MPNSWGQIDLPAGLVTATTTFTYTQMTSPTLGVGGFAFAGRSFTVIARDDQGDPVTGFSGTFTITLNHEDSDWQNAGILDESGLNLYYWNGSDRAGVLLCAGYSLDTVNNRLMARLNYLSEFAVLGTPTNRVYLPVITPRL